jgi:four helix bundle protein
MDKQDWSVTNKPYDLRERLFLFACTIVRLVQYLHEQGRIAVTLSDQILNAANSAGANYEESDDGSSPRDKLAKRRIALRELKESLFRLRVLRATGYLSTAHDPVIDENVELKRILATVIRNAKKKLESERQEKTGSREP